jgi:chemotaxis protein methyltransferase WspC
MIEQILKDKIGLDCDVIGRPNVAHAVNTQMKKCGINHEADFVRLISESKPHFDALTELLVVNETWFFRYGDSFKLLSEYAAKFSIGKRRIIRILSLPCSSGEEPYSIAMTLLNAGISAAMIHIDAVDISDAALRLAKRAVYGSNSFRSGIPDSMRIFFTSANDNFEVVQQVRSLVKFHHRNIFDEDFAAGSQPYDIIFCRNLLIYFSGEKRAAAMTVLTEMLADNGLLFVGHVEPSIVSRRDFEPSQRPAAFAFYKNGATVVPPPPKVKPKPILPLPAVKVKVNPKQHTAKIIEPAAAESSGSDALTRATALADSGKMLEAEKLCRDYLENNKLNPVAYYLIGVINLSLDKLAESEKAFNQAVYLNPQYYEALVHLALLKERRGDHAGALQIKRRAELLNKVNKL